MNKKFLSKACIALTCTFVVSACSSQEEPNSQGSNAPEKLAIAAASKALISNGHDGFKPTGEILKEVDSKSESSYEIIFSNGSNTIEVDVLSASNTPTEIEEDIELKDIPNEVQKAAAKTGEDINLCGHYQKATKLDADNEVWYEFEECNDGKIDIEVKEEGLEVVTDIEDKTAREIP